MNQAGEIMMDRKEEAIMEQKLLRIENTIKDKEGWHLETWERYGTLYVTVFKWWWSKPEWLDELIEQMETNQRMIVSRVWHFGYGIKDCRLSCSDDIALGFVAAVNAAESMPAGTENETRIDEGISAMYSHVPHCGPEICGQGSMG